MVKGRLLKIVGLGVIALCLCGQNFAAAQATTGVVFGSVKGSRPAR